MAYKRGPSRQGIAKARKESREKRFRKIEEMRQNTIDRMRNKMIPLGKMKKPKPGSFDYMLEQTMKPGYKVAPMLTGGQAKIAAKAPPFNKIDGNDFAVLRKEKAKGRGKGLQDEKMKPGKIMKAGKGTSVKISGEKLSLDKALRMQKEGKINPKTGKFTSIDALRESKGFKPGESAKSFNQRQAAIKFAKEGVKATRVGKIVLPIALAGVAGIQYLKSRIKKNKEKAKKKMGGGMMMKPIMANKGVMTGAKYRKYLRGLKKVTDASVATNIANRLNRLKSVGKKNKLTPGMKKRMVDATDKILKSGKSLTGEDILPRRITLGGGAGLVLKGAVAVTKALKKLKPSKKMGGGMMMRRPMMANKGKIATVEGKKKVASLRERAEKFGNKGKGILKEIMYGKKDPKGSSKYMGSFMGGGMMPGYKKGKSVMAKGCKLGRKKPTKMYT